MPKRSRPRWLPDSGNQTGRINNGGEIINFCFPSFRREIVYRNSDVIQKRDWRRIISIFQEKKQLEGRFVPEKIDRRIALVSYRPSPWLNRIAFDFRNRSRKYSSQGISRDERCAASGDVISKNVQLRLGDGRRPLHRDPRVTFQSIRNNPIALERLYFEYYKKRK